METKVSSFSSADHRQVMTRLAIAIVRNVPVLNDGVCQHSRCVSSGGFHSWAKTLPSNPACTRQTVAGLQQQSPEAANASTPRNPNGVGQVRPLRTTGRILKCNRAGTSRRHRTSRPHRHRGIEVAIALVPGMSSAIRQRRSLGLVESRKSRQGRAPPPVGR